MFGSIGNTFGMLAAVVLIAVMVFGDESFGQVTTPPDRPNVPYGPAERNVLDLWKAQSDEPTPVVIFFHGGGFSSGDKREHLYKQFLDECLSRGISLISANYRYSGQEIYPAQMLDGARVIQFVRANAADWGLDPDRVILAGGSAGGGMALWLALHDDLADPNSEDPIARQSTRVDGAVGFNAQSTYDILWIREHINTKTGDMSFLRRLYGLNPDEVESDKAKQLYKEAAPISYVSADDPALFLYHWVSDAPITEETGEGTGIHHVKFSRVLKNEMDKVGVECIVRSPSDYEGKTDHQEAYQEMMAFITKQFEMENATPTAP